MEKESVCVCVCVCAREERERERERDRWMGDVCVVCINRLQISAILFQHQIITKRCFVSDWIIFST